MTKPSRALMLASIFVPVSLLAPARAFAQPFPSPGVEAPSNLDPGATGTQNRTIAPPQPTAPAQGKTNLVVVGPDGKVTNVDQQEPADNGYYISGGQVQPNEPNDVHGGPVPELHVVRQGDTLWDICFYYFSDPWQWPKVWSYNPQITNPHWIYPGDLVRLLPRGQYVETGPEPGPSIEPQPQQPLPSPSRKLEVGIKQVAFVQKSDLDKSVTIDGAVDEKELLGDGDSVYLSYPEGKPPQVGQRYSVYEPGKEVKDGSNSYGSYVRVLGTLEVVSVKQDKRARGVIVQANREIYRGAKVGPLIKTYKTVPPVQPSVDAQAKIVGVLSHGDLIGDGEVVFIGANKSSGIEVGNRMYIVRRGDAKPPKMDRGAGQDDRRYPARSLGEVTVVEVGENVVIGLVTLSVQEIAVGDIVMMQKAK